MQWYVLIRPSESWPFLNSVSQFDIFRHLFQQTVSAAPSENPFDDASSSDSFSDESSFFGDNEQVGIAAVKEYIDCYFGAVSAGLKNTTFEQQWTTETLPQCQETLAELSDCEQNDEPEAYAFLSSFVLHICVAHNEFFSIYFVDVFRCFAEKVFELIAQLTDSFVNAPVRCMFIVFDIISNVSLQ